MSPQGQERRFPEVRVTSGFSDNGHWPGGWHFRLCNFVMRHRIRPIAAGKHRWVSEPITIGSGWIGAAGGAPMPSHEALCRTHDARRPTPRNVLAVALLRKVFPFIAARMRRHGDPVGRRNVKRQAAAFCPVHHPAATRARRSSGRVGAALMSAFCRFRFRLTEKLSGAQYRTTSHAANPAHY